MDKVDDSDRLLHVHTVSIETDYDDSGVDKVQESGPKDGTLRVLWMLCNDSFTCHVHVFIFLLLGWLCFISYETIVILYWLFALFNMNQ